MSLAHQAPETGAAALPSRDSSLLTNWGLLLAALALISIMLLPTPAGLPVAGHRMLAVLAFAVVVWMTEALDYAVSAVVIAALMAFLLGLSPNPANPAALMGTSAGLTLAFSGFANTALALVASALFLAAAMTATGLDKRIALVILSRVGAETRHVVIGAIFVGFVMAFLVPSTTARVACLVPITLGIIAAFGVSRKGAFASMLMITTTRPPASGTSASRPRPPRTWSPSASSRRPSRPPSPGSNGSWPPPLSPPSCRLRSTSS